MREENTSWVVVSGSTSGIGRATTRGLVARGHQVVGLGRNREALCTLEQELGSSFKAFAGDFADPESLESCIAQVVRFCPEVKAVVSNAAECTYGSVLDFSAEHLLRLMTVNILGPIALARALTPIFSSGGIFIQLSSVVGRQLPGAKFAAYAATKAAMDVIVDGLRYELAPKKIRVATITPGLVDTPIYDKVEGFEKARQKITEQVPDWLRAEDVADGIVFMLEQPSHVSISDLVIMPTAQTR